MQFGEFTRILNKYFEALGNHQDFMCFLMKSVMGGPVTPEDQAADEENEFYPFTKLETRSSAYKAYSGKQFPKNVATHVLGHFAPDELKGYIDDLDTKDDLAKKLTAAGLPCTSGTVADKVADYIKTYLESIENNTNASRSMVSASTAVSLNSTYSDYAVELLAEVNNKCPLCGAPLFTKHNGVSRPLYEIVKIYEDDEADYDNLIPLCPNCKANYDLATEAERDELLVIKMDLSSLLRVQEIISKWDIAEGLEKVISAIPQIPPEHLSLRYDPCAVKEKIDPIKDVFLYFKVFNYASMYYPDVEQIFKAQVKENRFKYDAFCTQVKARYIEFRDEGLSKMRIYDALVQWLMDKTRGERVYCEIITSFFVQKCEVFE